MTTMMSSSRRCKAQIAFEYMFIFGILMAAIIMGTAFAWSKSVEISNQMTRLEVDSLLIRVSDKINTAWLEGEGFSTNITIPEKVADSGFTLNVTSNFLVLSVLEQDFTRPIITKNVTGNFSIGGLNNLANKGDHIAITHL
ncbi:MAG: hypothetical protein JXC85_05770 [Candidatus Aenigmarchaeota archaeon]|nr:hypothetical protein [Candidatus Aenigmarchaeota archaeon]